jgi:hypothetical protein
MNGNYFTITNMTVNTLFNIKMGYFAMTSKQFKVFKVFETRNTFETHDDIVSQCACVKSIVLKNGSNGK